MQNNDILDDVMALYKKQGVQLLHTTWLSPDAPDTADLEGMQVIMNMNSRWRDQYQFRIVHEIMHFIKGTKSSRRLVAYNGYDVKNEDERIANRAAIEWLWDKYHANVDSPNWLAFMDWFGIPSFLESMVQSVIAE